MGRRAKRFLLVGLTCAALAAAFALALSTGSPGTRHVARSVSVYAEPQITYCTSIKYVSAKSRPTSFPATACKRLSSSTKTG
jgi:hypothetical protein